MADRDKSIRRYAIIKEDGKVRFYLWERSRLRIPLTEISQGPFKGIGKAMQNKPWTQLVEAAYEQRRRLRRSPHHG